MSHTQEQLWIQRVELQGRYTEAFPISIISFSDIFHKALIIYIPEELSLFLKDSSLKHPKDLSLLLNELICHVFSSVV